MKGQLTLKILAWCIIMPSLRGSTSAAAARTDRSTVAELRKAADDKRVELKKKNSEDRKAEEDAKKAEEARALAEAIKSNEEWTKAKEKETDQNNEGMEDDDISLVLPDMELDIDKPDANINNYLSALNSTVDPEMNSSLKIKRKTSKTKTKLKPVLKSSMKNQELMKDYEHANKHVLILASITAKLPSEDKSDRISAFVGATRAVLTEMRKVNDKLCMDHLYKPGIKLLEPARIPVNQTDFGSYVKISAWGNKNPFNKQKDKDKNKKKNGDEWKDPVVYFQFSISCDEEPTYVLERVRNEWFRIGGGKLEVKEFQALDVRQTHSIYFVTTQGNDTAILVKELKQMMDKVKEISWMDEVDTTHSGILLKSLSAPTCQRLKDKIRRNSTSSHTT